MASSNKPHSTPKPKPTPFSWDGIVIAIPLLIILLVYSEKVPDPALLPKFLALSIYLLGLILLVIRKDRAGKTIDISVVKHKIILWFGLYFLVSVITLFYTRNFADGLFDTLKIFLTFSILICLSIWFKNSKHLLITLTKAVTIFALGAALFGIYQLGQTIQMLGMKHFSTRVIMATFANRNLYAEVLFLTLPFVLYGLIVIKTKFKMVSLLATFLVSFLIITIQVRAVWAAVLVGGLVCLLTLTIHHFTKREGSASLRWSKNNLLITGVLLVSVLASFLVLSGKGGFRELEEKGMSITKYSEGTGKARLDMWKHSINLIEENPIMGTGVGSWKIDVLKYNVKGMRNEDAVTYYQSPHNDFLWVFAEMGLAGILFYVLIFGTCIYYIFYLLRNESDAQKRTLWYLLLFGICGYVTFSNFSFPRERMEQQTLLILMLLPVVLSSNPLKKKQLLINQKWLYAGLAVAALLIFFGFKRFGSEMHYKNVHYAWMNQNLEEIISETDKAITPIYEIDPTSTPLKWYSGTAWFRMGENQKAYKDFEEAYKLNPYHIQVLNDFATCKELNGAHEEAIKMYEQVLKINPSFEEARLNLCAVHFGQGRYDKAFRQLLRTKPNSKNPKIRTYVIGVVGARIEQMVNGNWPNVSYEKLNSIKASEELSFQVLENAKKNKLNLTEELKKESVDEGRIRFNEVEK